MDDEGGLVAALVGELSALALLDVQIHREDGSVLHAPARVRALRADELRRALAGERITTPERRVFPVRSAGRTLVCAVFEPPNLPSDARPMGDFAALLTKLRDRELTTRAIVALPVPDLADACLLDVAEPHGAVRQREVAAQDPATLAILRRMSDVAPVHVARAHSSPPSSLAPDAAARLPGVIAQRTASPVLVPDVQDAHLRRWARDPDHLAALRELAPKSTLAVPLAVRGEVIGALTLHRLTARPFTSRDLAVVDEVARFAALALENALLFEALERAHREATTARDRLQEILMRAPFAIAVREGPEHRLRLANDRHVVVMRRDREPGKTFAETFPELPEQLGILGRVYAEGEPYMNPELHVRMLDRDGLPDDVCLEYVVQPLRAADGTIEGTISFAVDVTSLVRARKEADSLARSIAEHEKWLEALLDRLPVPVILEDAQTAAVLLANKAAAALAGGEFHRQSSRGDELAGFAVFDAAGCRIAFEQMPGRRAARGETVQGLQLEWAVSGERKSLMANAVLLPQHGAHPATVVVTFGDVTRLMAMEAALQRAVRVRDDFLSIASHELKTPLTAMRLQVQGLRRAVKEGRESALSPQRLVVRLGEIDKNVDRLAALVDKLLSMPQMMSGRLALERKGMDLAELVDEALAQVEVEATRRGSHLTAAIARPVRGSWDRIALDQVLTNLLANAVKYGSGRPIHVALSDGGDSALLVVQDSGIGVAREDQERIFERFERAVSERNYGGFGLGLYIVRHIVEAHGGSVSVQSTAGEGATFRVRLPKGEAYRGGT